MNNVYDKNYKRPCSSFCISVASIVVIFSMILFNPLHVFAIVYLPGETIDSACLSIDTDCGVTPLIPESVKEEFTEEPLEESVDGPVETSIKEPIIIEELHINPTL